MRKAIIILLIITMISLVSAGSYAIGTMITQAQYNAIDFQTEEMNPTQWRVTLDNGVLYFDINYDTYVANGNNWVAQRAVQRLSYDVERYSACRASGRTISVCKNQMLQNVRTQWDYFEEDYRDFMERQKVDDFTREIDPRDLNIIFN